LREFCPGAAVGLFRTCVPSSDTKNKNKSRDFFSTFQWIFTVFFAREQELQQKTAEWNFPERLFQTAAYLSLKNMR